VCSVCRVISLPPPLAGEAWGGGKRIAQNVRTFPLPTAVASAVDLPRKREREKRGVVPNRVRRSRVIADLRQSG